MKQFVFSFLMLVIFAGSMAQPKLFTMEDAMLKARTSLAPENLRQLQFVKGTAGYIYVKSLGGADVWMRGDFKTAADTPYITLAKLNKLIKAQQLDTLKNLPPLEWCGAAQSFLVQKNKFITLNHANAAAPSIQVKDMNVMEGVLEYNPGFSHFAYLKDDNLFVSDFKNAAQVTTDGSSNIVYAQSVHRDEFGISKGTFWSNSGTQLAFYRMDQSMVTDYPIVNWTKRPAQNENIKYPMAGDKSHHVTLGVYDVTTQKTVYIKTGEPADQYLTNIAWSPDDKYIFIAVLNRQQNHMKLNQYDAATGDFIKTLFEEKDDKYTEPLHPMLFVKNNPGQFIWQSNRDGWNHLYLYSSNGTLIRQLTSGRWEVLDCNGFDAKGQKLFYTSTAESPITRNLYSLDMKTAISARLTPGTGIHDARVSDDGSMVIDIMSNTTTPRMINITDCKTQKQKKLLTAPDPLAGYAIAPIDIFTIKNQAGDDLYCRLFKPVGMEAGKKYPVIVYWYGGPHAQLIGNTWNAGASDLWFQYMAQRGYVVFSIDTRGSANRGKAFEQAIFRNIGNAQMQDMMAGVNYLKAQSFADETRMGLFGWSFGGFLTTDFMLSYPGVFKAAVAGGPVIDWKYYEIMYGERYMDTPQENPDGYAANDLTRRVDKLKGKLLLIHGLQDPVVVQQHSINFVNACVDKGVQVDYMIYPGQEHNMRGKSRVHLYQKVTNYFADNL
jgi:dipeptidyl-peptidase 4